MAVITVRGPASIRPEIADYAVVIQTRSTMHPYVVARIVSPMSPGLPSRPRQGEVLGLVAGVLKVIFLRHWP
jgi:hypothetical protein